MDIIGIDDIRGKSIKFHNHIIRRAMSFHFNAFCNCCPLGAPAIILGRLALWNALAGDISIICFLFPCTKSGGLSESFQLEVEAILVKYQSVILLTNKFSIANLQLVTILTT
jgi:hypothetical protein